MSAADDVPRLGTEAAKRARRIAIQAQGFELNPPRCTNCSHLQPPRHGKPVTSLSDAQPYRPATCALGRFEVKGWSICDRWQGKDGATLDSPTPTVPTATTEGDADAVDR